MENLTRSTICVVLLVIIGTACAQVISSGGCPHPTVKTDFDVEKYMGIWYEQEKYYFLPEVGGKCVYAKYELMPNGVVSVKNCQVGESNNEQSSIQGTATVAEPGKLLVVFPVSPVKPTAPNYWVLDTDYETYSVVFSCKEILNGMNGRLAWILTRERNPPYSVIEAAYEIFNKNEISTNGLLKTNQENCPDAI